MMLRDKYRPKSFKRFLGNEDTVKAIRANIEHQQVYLLHGPSGCGKTTLAHLIAKHRGTRRGHFDFHAVFYGGGLNFPRSIIQDSQPGRLTPCRIYLISEIVCRM